MDDDLALRIARAAALVMFGLPELAFIYQRDGLGLPEDFESAPEQVQDPLCCDLDTGLKNGTGVGYRCFSLQRARDSDSAPNGLSWLPKPSWFDKHTVKGGLVIPLLSGDVLKRLFLRKRRVVSWYSSQLS